LALMCLTTENPEDPRAWSGSAVHFYNALKAKGLLTSVQQISLPKTTQYYHQLLSLNPTRDRWRENYNSAVDRFSDLSLIANKATRRVIDTKAILQIGARFKPPMNSGLPVFGYFDGNAAMRYRHFDKFGISQQRKLAHIAFEKKAIESMSAIFVMSHWLARSFIADYKIDKSKIHVVGAGINFRTLPEIPNRTFTDKRIIFIGKEFERKGGNFLLKSFELAKKSVPTLSLTIVGPEARRSDIPGVHFAGFLSKTNETQHCILQSLLDSASMLVLPSEYEPFGISLLEGMANGLPCITVNNCAMPEIVVNGSTGFVVEYGNTQQFAKSICDLALDNDKSRVFGQAGRARIEAEFTWPRIADKIATVLAEKFKITPI
jgi:glycosyltransferase involved in cell wall biosynthesis